MPAGPRVLTATGQRDLEQLGVFRSCSGLIVGRPMYFSEQERNDLWELLASYSQRHDIPALGNVDCGHADPMLTLPLGVPSTLNASAQEITIHL